MYGITCQMLRILCDAEWEGGAGYTPEQVAVMTPDQVYFRLCNRKFIRGAKQKVDALESLSFAKDGKIKGRLADGTRVERPAPTGKSQVQLVKERQAAEAAKKTGRRGRRRRRHGS